MISLSVVSHGQGALLDPLLAQIDAIAKTMAIELIVTNNIPDGYAYANLPTHCPVQIIANPYPLGFGHNHNQAFAHANGQYFCILNPDIRLIENPFPALLDAYAATGAGAVAPAILAPSQAIEDSARRFPNPLSLLIRRLGGADGRYHYTLDTPAFAVDWVAGMFIMFDRDVFARIGGFDQGYFLYCEDIDVCMRIGRIGRSVILCPAATAIHAAQRASHRNAKYLRWHVSSYLRYFAKRYLPGLVTSKRYAA